MAQRKEEAKMMGVNIATYSVGKGLLEGLCEAAMMAGQGRFQITPASLLIAKIVRYGRGVNGVRWRIGCWQMLVQVVVVIKVIKG